MQFKRVGASPPKSDREEGKYNAFIKFVQEIEPGTGEGIVVPRSEVKSFQMVALALSCHRTDGSYRKQRMKDRRVETRTEEVEGGVRIDVYVTEVEDAKEST